MEAESAAGPSIVNGVNGTHDAPHSRVEEATALIKTNPKQAEEVLKQVVQQQDESGSAEAAREKEAALLKLGELYRDQRDAAQLADVVKLSRDLPIAKAKTAKLVRTLIDFFGDIPGSRHTQVDVTKQNIEWASNEKRIFLKQSLETRLAALYFEDHAFRDALGLVTTLLKELRRLDDKMILTEVHLLESRIHHALVNMPKAKSALTSARTAANAIYCPPLLQAQLDMQSGILHAEDKDYKTGYSYFYEALESYAAQDDKRAVAALKYMLLCKVMLNSPEDVTALVQGKLAQRYAGRDLDALKAVAKAHENRSLADFELALKTFKQELSDDPIVRNHLAALYDTLLEQNLVRVIEPYSRIELSYVAEMVQQPTRDVEAKLSQMILDRVFFGILDQGAGCLNVFEEPQEDKTYSGTIDTLKAVGEVVDGIYAKATKLA